MRVVHINYDGAGWGGASIAMLRIHESYKKSGWESIIACRTMAQYSDAQVLPCHPFLRFQGLLLRVFMKVFFGRVYRSGLISTGMADFVNQMNPDKVVIHWLHIDTISLKEIARLRAPQIEWWIHDLWPLSGTDPYPKSDWFKKGAPRENLISRLSWYQKVILVNKIRDRLTVIGPSQWACQEARESVVFKDVPIRHEHYPLSAAFQNCRAENHKGSSAGQFVILFGSSVGTKNHIKGFDRLLCAIKLLPDEMRRRTELRIFGEDGSDGMADGICLKYLGALNEEGLISAYQSSDVFAFPSYQETWGQVKAEAIACGCPVIAFDETACAEGLIHLKTGWIAKSVGDFKEGLEHYFNLKNGG